MKKIFAICFLLSTCCYASLWNEFYYKNYIDLTTVQRNGHIVSVWAKELNPGNWHLINNKKIWYAIVKYNADCDNRKLKIMSLTSYDTKGNLLENFDNSTYGNWDDVIPDTVGEIKYNYFCSLK